MTTEIPKQLFDFGVHRQIDLQRYGNKVVQDVISLLNASEKDILAKIAQRDEDGTWTAARLKALFKEIGQMNYDAHVEAGKLAAQEMYGFADHQAEATAAVLGTQVPVAFSVLTPTAAQLAAIVDKEPVTVGNGGKLLLEEIFSSLAAGKEEAIRAAIRLGVFEGESTPEIVRRLRGTRSARYTDGVLEGSRRNTAAMVRTVTNHVGNSATQRVYSENSDIVKGWVFLATLDARTTLQCRGFSGQTFPVGEGPIPPLHISCRSFVLPQIKSWKELGVDLEEMPPSTRASADGPVRADISMDEWMRTKSPAEVTDMLGASRAKLFLDGKMDIKAFTDSKGETYTLPELKQRHEELFKKVFGS